MNVSLYQAAAALDANSRWQDAIAENLASSSIPGYKRQSVSFSSIQAGLMETSGTQAPDQHFGLPKDNSSIDFASGQLRPTGVETDVAIEGNGFFEVGLPSGSSAYTRDGEFQVNSQGALVTKQGYPVQGQGGPIQLDPRKRGVLTITADGHITEGTTPVGQLKLTDFKNRQALTHLGGGYFQANSLSAQATDATGTNVRQGFLEGANTTPVSEMVGLLGAMRSYEANQRLIQVNDDRMGQAIRDLSGAS